MMKIIKETDNLFHLYIKKVDAWLTRAEVDELMEKIKEKL